MYINFRKIRFTSYQNVNTHSSFNYDIHKISKQCSHLHNCFLQQPIHGNRCKKSEHLTANKRKFKTSAFRYSKESNGPR